MAGCGLRLHFFGGKCCKSWRGCDSAAGSTGRRPLDGPFARPELEPRAWLLTGRAEHCQRLAANARRGPGLPRWALQARGWHSWLQTRRLPPHPLPGAIQLASPPPRPHRPRGSLFAFDLLGREFHRSLTSTVGSHDFLPASGCT